MNENRGIHLTMEAKRLFMDTGRNKDYESHIILLVLIRDVSGDDT